MRAVLATLTVITSVACSATPATSADDPVTPADAGPDASKNDAGKDGGLGAAVNCERDVAMGALSSISNPACFVNEHVSNHTTKLQFLCAGGLATAAFGAHTFTGTVSGGVISLTDVEPFVFNNCDWLSTEKIEGDLSKGTVTYSYSEKPVTSCPDDPCTATGDLAAVAGEIDMVK